jgi:2'-5' RNA ligase
MRAFVGYFTTHKIAEGLDRVRDDSKDFLRGKWVEPQNLHVTYQFLGDISREQALDVIKNLQIISEKIKPFNVQYKALGVFPDRRRPRILWVGVSRGSNILKRVSSEVLKLNRRVGINPEGKPFYPHVTICRIKSVESRPFRNLLDRYKNFTFGEEKVDRIALISSSLSSIGPAYTVVEEFYLRD